MMALSARMEDLVRQQATRLEESPTDHFLEDQTCAGFEEAFAHIVNTDASGLADTTRGAYDLSGLASRFEYELNQSLCPSPDSATSVCRPLSKLIESACLVVSTTSRIRLSIRDTWPCSRCFMDRRGQAWINPRRFHTSKNSVRKKCLHQGLDLKHHNTRQMQESLILYQQVFASRSGLQAPEHPSDAGKLRPISLAKAKI